MTYLSSFETKKDDINHMTMINWITAIIILVFGILSVVACEVLAAPGFALILLAVGVFLGLGIKFTLILGIYGDIGFKI